MGPVPREASSEEHEANELSSCIIFCTYRSPSLSYMFLEDFVTLTALCLEQMLTMQRDVV